MRTALFVALILSGCIGAQPSEEGPPGEGGTPPGPSVTETMTQTPGPRIPGPAMASLLDCMRSAVLLRASETATRALVPDQYAFSGQGLVNAVLLLASCDKATIGNHTSLDQVRLAFVYVFIDEPNTGALPVYLIEAFTDDPALVSFMQSLGMPAQQAAIDLAVGVEGGTYGVSGPVTYSGTVASPLDENGNIQDGSFAFYHDDGLLNITRLTETFDISSQLVAASLLTASGGALGAMLPGGSQSVLVDRSYVDATLELAK